MCGTPQDIVEQLEDFRELGINEVVLDFRLQFEEYDEVLERVGGALRKAGLGEP
jgi:alkanesulfonate monooxygenase SsuD/methylene tetrahydromethanopterin reductase-like flavin-dependent oxidoreductase (luciferase family)